MLYIWDAMLDMYVEQTRREQRHWLRYIFRWSVLRLICSTLIPINCIATIANVDQANGAIVRCLYPLLLISRDQNYKELVKGLFFSIRHTWVVYSLLLSLLVGFSFVGFFLFHRVDTSAGHFQNIGTSFAVVLHCFTSSPYSLFVVDPFFAVNNAVLLFFLLLSYSTEVFCIGLILATGTFFYRSFSDYTLKNRLLKRHEGITNIWYLFESEDSTMCLDDWLSFCEAISSKYRIDPVSAFDLYMYVCKASPLDDMNKNMDLTLETISQPQFFRLCALLYIGARCRKCDSVKQFHAIRRKANAYRTIEDQSILDIINSMAGPEGSSTHGGGSTMEMVSAMRRSSLSKASHATSLSADEKRFFSFPFKLSRSRSKSKEGGGKRKSRRMSAATVRFSESSNPLRTSSATTFRMKSSPRQKNYQFEGLYKDVKVLYVQENKSSILTYAAFGSFAVWAEMVAKACQFIISVELWGKVCVYEMISILMHVLLIVQLSFFTSAEGTSLGWTHFGYFLLIYFCWEMVTRMLALGEQVYFRNNVYFIQFVLNVLSFVFMVAMGNNIYGTGVFFLLTVLIQCFRLGLMLWLERGDDKLKYLFVVGARSIFLLISAIYCFGVLSQDFFCGVLPYDSDPGEERGPALT